MKRLFFCLLLLLIVVHFSYTENDNRKSIGLERVLNYGNKIRYYGAQHIFKDPPHPNVIPWPRRMPISHPAFPFLANRRFKQRANLPWATDFKWNRYLLYNSLPPAGPAYGGDPYFYSASEIIDDYQNSLYSYMYPLLSSSSYEPTALEPKPMVTPHPQQIEVPTPLQPILLDAQPIAQPTRNPLTFVEALQLAHEQLNRGDAAKAATLFQKCVKEKQQNNSAMMGLALAGLETGNYKTAKVALEKALARQKDWLIQPPVFSFSIKNRASFQLAMDSLRLEIEKNSLESLRFLYGYGLYLQGKNHESLTVLQRMRRNDPQYPAAQRLIMKLEAIIGEEAMGKP